MLRIKMDRKEAESRMRVIMGISGDQKVSDVAQKLLDSPTFKQWKSSK